MTVNVLMVAEKPSICTAIATALASKILFAQNSHDTYRILYIFALSWFMCFLLVSKTLLNIT